MFFCSGVFANQSAHVHLDMTVFSFSPLAHQELGAAGCYAVGDGIALIFARAGGHFNWVSLAFHTENQTNQLVF